VKELNASENTRTDDEGTGMEVAVGDSNKDFQRSQVEPNTLGFQKL